MTFEQFQQTREFEPNLRARFGSDFFETETAGFVYGGAFWIEIRNGQFWSQIGYHEMQSPDLTAVESWLFDSEIKLILESDDSELESDDSEFCRCGKLLNRCDC